MSVVLPDRVPVLCVVPCPPPLRIATCLAPHLCWFYRFLACSIGKRLGRPTELLADASYEQLADADIAFVCSLAYIEQATISSRFEAIAAPVLAGDRYDNQAIYYSDVIVRCDSAFLSFADLRGASWAYNEKYSQSGYGITRYHLTQLGETSGYFGKVIEAGWHERAIGLVASGQVDAAAIDSHVLETWLPLHPEVARLVRVIASLGPSPIQPVAVRRNLPQRCKEEVRAALCHLEHEQDGRSQMAGASVKRFVAVDDCTYDPIRAMREASAATRL